MALSAANIVYPAVSILLAVGIMFGTGGSAVVAAKIGQGKQEEANRNFSALTLTTLIIGILGAVLGNLFCRQICSLPPICGRSFPLPRSVFSRRCSSPSL